MASDLDGQDMARESEGALRSLIAHVLELEQRNELVQAFDLAKNALLEYPQSLWLKHRSVLCLLRLGSIRSAQALLRDFGLVGRLEEELAVLPAKIAKQEAIEAPSELRRDLSRIAAEIYESVFRGPTGTFASGIEAASMRLVAGDTTRSRELALEVLRLLDAPQDDADDYEINATRSEALLLVGDAAGAREAIKRAAKRATIDISARVATCKQIRLVCRHLGVDASFLNLLETPAVLHYSSAFDAPFSPKDLAAALDARTEDDLAEAMSDDHVGYGYGSLACYRDIVCAETLIARGVELHIVLPHSELLMLEQIGRLLDDPWRARFSACLERASSIRSAATDGSVLDSELVKFADDFANGLARLHAELLDSEVRTVEFSLRSDRTRSPEESEAKNRTKGAPVAAHDHASAGGSATLAFADPPLETSEERRARAILFGDAAGFSRLSDRQVLTFFKTVMDNIDAELAPYADDVLHRNTWGDGFSLVFTTIELAARCALSIQERLELLDYGAHGLPSGIGFRMGGHYGMVYEVTDPITKRSNFIGSEMSRTARIEPVTPEGEVYVTDAFAAHLTLAAPEEFRCDYVGHIPAAKDWGAMPMYLLRRAADISLVRSYETIEF